MTPHPYAEILRAIADGKQIQALVPTGEWMNVRSCQVLDNAANGPYAADHFRIKPEPKIARYRVAEMRSQYSGNYTYTDDGNEQSRLDQTPNFVRWLTDWIEYEVTDA